MRSLRVALRIASVRLGFALGRRRQQRHRVLLATSHLDHLSGNLALLRDDLARRHPEIERLEIAHRPRGGILGRLGALVEEGRAGYRLARSRMIVVDDYYFPIYVIRPRPGTTIMQVWHACGAFKQFGYSVRDKTFGADDALLRRVPIHANYDICLVSSLALAPHYAEAFDLPQERFRSDLGIPRTDVFRDEGRMPAVAAEVRARYAIPPGKRIILYAPTFRGDSVGAARADGLADFAVLREALGADHVLLVRLHPFIRRGLDLSGLADFAIDVTAHPEINELLLAADVLVTDYSSVIFEYALLGRPMVFFAPDLDAYERERGFYFDYRSGVPGPVVETSAALAAALRWPADDVARVVAFARRSFDVADGGATRRVVDQIILPAVDG